MRLPVTETVAVFVGAHTGSLARMKSRERLTSANTLGEWSAPHLSPPQLTTPTCTGALSGPTTSGPPLSPKQPELSGSRPSTSTAQRMRAALKRSPVPGRLRANAAAHSRSESWRSVACRSPPPVRISASLWPVPGANGKPVPTIRAGPVASPSVTGVTPTTG